MSTRFRHHPTCIIPAASEKVVNDYIERQGLGRCFSIPLVIGASGELVKDSEPLVTHYGTSLKMDDGMSGIVNRLLQANGGERIEKRWHQALIDKNGKRDIESHPYQLIVVIPVAYRTNIITRLTVRYPDAEARFFKVGLSATGSAPATRYVDWWYAAPAFQPLLDTLIKNLPRSEVFIGCRDGNREAVKTLYGDPKYQDPNAGIRTLARVWINGQWDKAEVLGKLSLKIIQ